MDYYRKKFYNKDTKEFKENAPKHILMLDFSGQELEKLCKGDKMMEKFKENVDALNDNSTVINFLTKEEEERIQKEAYMREGYENGIETGEKNGIKIGRKEERLALAKKMINKNININDIAEITNLSLEELQKLQKAA